jgi:hypothetical protein
MIVPSHKDYLCFQLRSIYAFLIFLIGYERAERAIPTRKYVTAIAPTVADATKPEGEKMHIRVKPEVETETETMMDKNKEHSSQ